MLLCGVFCGSIRIFEIFVLVLWKRKGILIGLHWIYRLLWVVWIFFLTFDVFFSFFLLLFKYSCPIFPPPLSPVPSTFTSTLNPTPFWLCPLVLYTCSLMTLPILSPIISHLTTPLVTVSLFFISMSLVIFCLLVCVADYVPLIGEIIWYLSYTAWLNSLSIMLSSSIHAKGTSSFFLSAA